ncbi:hypothetical protein B7P33_06385 [Sediminicola luteus]|uniref:Cytochrome c domain-containing protein n=1 Tax=Sediminicola luteus TaxID=319238 RepID=A0A2A4GA04_9FLAO|nr:hypothetical protein B7P33_06385 [Sediminicola luteus]
MSLPFGCTTAIIDDDGALPPITRRVTYQADVKQIMTNNCITCHGGPAPDAGLDLTTYEHTKASGQTGQLSGRMNNINNPMPQNGLLSPETRQLVDKWIADGYPEN